MKERTLEDLFHETLRDIYYAERVILKALPKMSRAARSPQLQKAFQQHRQETEGQIGRLEQVFGLAGQGAGGKACPAVDGMIEETMELIEEYRSSRALDAGLVACAQAIGHYGITRYGTLRRWAQELGMSEAADLLSRNLAEEARSDDMLTQIAEADANARGRAQPDPPR